MLVAIAGATGRTGSCIVKELIKRGCQVRALVRTSARGEWIKALGGDVVEADISSFDHLCKVLEGADAVISALGSKKPFSSRENNLVDNEGNRNIAEAAKKAGLKHMVMISSIGVGNSKHALNFIFRMILTPVLKKKEKSEIALRSCGLDYTIIRPGGLTDKPLSGDIVFGEEGKITGSINRSEVAVACVDAIVNPAMKNRTLEVVDASTLKDDMRQDVIKI